MSTEIELAAIEQIGPESASTTLITVGNLDGLADHLPANTRVISVTPPADAFRTIPPVLAAALPAAGRVVVALGDISHPDTYTGAQRLGQYCQAYGLDVAYLTRVSNLPDQMFAAPEERRSQLLAGFISQAVAKYPARPPAKAPKSALAPRVDWTRAQIRIPGEPPVVLAEFAARRVKTTTVRSDQAGAHGRAEQIDVFHTLEVAYRDPQSGEIVNATIENVPDAHLSQPRLYLNRLRGGAGIVISPDHGTASYVEAAVRTDRADACEELTAVSRYGWYSIAPGRWGFLTQKGAVCASGVDDSATAVVDNRVRVLTQPPAKGARPWEYWGAVLGLVDPTVGAVLAGTFALTFSGWNPTGCAAILGAPGSGKTHLSSIVLAPTNPALTPGVSQASFDGSAASLRQLTTGLDACLLIVDDKRETSAEPGRESREQVAARTGLENFLRLSYGGPSAAHSVQQFDKANNRWTNTMQDSSWPGIAIIGEKLPELPLSSYQRMLPVYVSRETAFRGGTAHELEQLLGDPASADGVLFHFLSWLAARRDAAGTERAWMEEGAARRAAAEDAIAKLYPDLPRRALEVASGPVMGCALLAEYIAEHDDFLHSDTLSLATKLIADAQKAHWDGLTVSSREPHEAILDVLRAAVLSGQARLSRRKVTGAFDDLNLSMNGTSEYSRRIGWLQGTHADRWVALLPSEATRVLAGTRYVGMSPDELAKVFAPVSLRAANRGLTRTVNVSGTATKVIALPVEVWFGTDEIDESMWEVAA